MEFLSRKARGIAPEAERPQDRTYIKLNTNENPYPPSPEAAKALRAFAAETLRLYPRPDAGLLRAAIARAESFFKGNTSQQISLHCMEASRGICFI